MVNKNNLVKLLKELVSINSVTGNENEIVRYIKNYLEESGIEVKLQEVEKDRKNVIAMTENNKKVLILSGHVDTVDVVDGWLLNPFELKISNGKAYGLGALDMKSGIAILIELFRELYDKMENLDLWLVLTVDEEGNSYGMYKFLSEFVGRNNSNFIGAIFTEPLPGNRIALVDRAFGRFAVDVIINTEGGHAAFVNKDFSEVLGKIARGLSILKSYEKDSSIGRCKYIVSKFEAGGEFLSYPSRVTIRINHIAVPSESLESTIREVEEAFNKAGLEVIVKPISRPTPFLEPFDCSDSFIASVFSKYVNERGVALSVFDGNLTAMFGIPTINIGPVGGNIHLPNEFVEIESIIKVYEILRKGILDMKKLLK